MSNNGWWRGVRVRPEAMREGNVIHSQSTPFIPSPMTRTVDPEAGLPWNSHYRNRAYSGIEGSLSDCLPHPGHAVLLNLGLGTRLEGEGGGRRLLKRCRCYLTGGPSKVSNVQRAMCRYGAFRLFFFFFPATELDCTC